MFVLLITVLLFEVFLTQISGYRLCGLPVINYQKTTRQTSGRFQLNLNVNCNKFVQSTGVIYIQMFLD